MAPESPIRLLGDPVLREVCAPVEEFDSELTDIVAALTRAMEISPHHVAVAAPQLGVAKQVFVYNVGAGPVAVVNPLLNDLRGEWLFKEGCLSLPGMAWWLNRPRFVTLEAFDVDGNVLSVEASDIEGRIFQHEVDHLNGRLVIDRLPLSRRKQAEREMARRTAA